MRRGYRRYRGGGRRVGCLIPTLIILCIIAAGVLFYLNNHLAVGPDGMVLKLPFSEKTITFGGKEEEEVPLIIETEPEEEQNKPETAEPEQPKVPEYEERIENSVFFPKDVVLDAQALDAALAKLAGSAVNTVILEVKAEDGTLAMSTTYSAAIDAGLNEVDNTALQAALTKVSDAGFHAVAQISCFRDNKMARKNQTLACRTKNRVIWLDYDNITWLNPFVAEARAYLTTLVEDVYALGFKEILLTNLSFPVNGKTSILYYLQEQDLTKQDAMKTFFSEIKLLCESKTDLRVAARYDNYSTKKEQTPGGQALADLVENFYRIYAPAEQGDGAAVAADVFDKAAQVIPAEAFATRFVPQINLDEVQKGTDIAALIASARQKSTGCALYAADGEYAAAALQSGASDTTVQ